MKLTRQGYERLLWVRSEILAEPNNYNQNHYFCGTAACIGGHLCINAVGFKGEHGYVARYLQKIGLNIMGDPFGVVSPDRLSTFLLFGADAPLPWLFAPLVSIFNRWPSDLSIKYLEGSAQDRAQAAAEAIDRFIAECGVEPEDENLPPILEPDEPELVEA